MMSKKVRSFLLIIISVLFSISIAEISLRIIGYQPGVFMTPKDFKNYRIDFDNATELCDCPFFSPDSNGILHLNTKKISIQNDCLKKFTHVEKVLRSCKLDEFGFRNGQFDILNTEKKRVMLVGDSYTFGFDAFPWDSSFSDLLGKLDTTLNVFNAGVPGADLATYEKVIELYNPIIEPDIVIVNINRGDIVQYNKALKPYSFNDIFLTNKGILFRENYHYKKDSLLVYEDSKSAYAYLKENYTIDRIKNKLLKSVFNHSAVLTLIVIVGDNRFNLNNRLFINTKSHLKEPRSILYTNNIIECCNKEGIKVMFSVIPGPPPFKRESEIISVQQLIGDYKLFYPDSINEVHYFREKEKNHFNNTGHLIYARHLLRLINN